MEHTITLFIFLSFNLSLLGMDQNVNLFPEHRDNPIAQKISCAILEYEKGNKTIAMPLLYDAHEEFQLNRLTYSVPGGILQKIYRILSIVETCQGNFDKAIVFSDKGFPDGGNNTDKGIIYRHKAKQAHDQGKIAEEQAYYKKAFRLFQGAALYDQRAAKYYEHALLNGIGCTKSLSDIRTHYLDQVKAHYSHIIQGIREDAYRKALKKLFSFAEDNVGTQCLIAKTYSNYEESEKYGFFISYDESLAWSEKAVLNLAKIPSSCTYPPEKISLSLALDRLCCNSLNNVKERALILKKYFTILCTIKDQQQEKLDILCSDTSYTILQSAILHLLCSKPLSNQTIQHIKNINFSHNDFLSFCKEEGKIAVPLLLEMAQKAPHEIKKYKDIFHMIIGGYEYVNNNLNAAYDHFIQCNHYKNDFYLQALCLGINTEKNITEKIRFLSVYMKKKWKQGLCEKDMSAQEIIAKKCEYDPLLPVDQHLSFCEHFLLKFIVSPPHDYSLEYLRFLLTIHDFCKKDSITPSDIQKKAITVSLYFDLFLALQEKNQQKIKSILSSFSPLQATILLAFNDNKTNEIKNIIFEGKEFQELSACDSFILIPLLEKILEQHNHPLSIKPHTWHYILGGLLYCQKNYQSAHKHFLLCDYRHDFYTQTKIIQTAEDHHRVQYINLLPNPSDTMVKNLKPSRKNQQRNNTPEHSNLRDQKAKKIIASLCIDESEKYIQSLLNKSSYSESYEYIYYLTQLQLPSTYQTIAKMVTSIEKKIATEQSSKEDYDNLINLTDRATALHAIQTIIDDKHTGKEFLCECIASILMLHAHSKWFDTATNSDFEKKCLPYLICSFKHAKLDENELITRKKECGKIACGIAQIENSIPLFDQAIEYGHTDALYYKSVLLSELPSTKDTFIAQRALLQQHAESNSTMKDLSLKRLGLFYCKENDKESFSYLNKITQKDTEVLESLAIFYMNGIKENGDWFQEPDLNRAELCLTAVIHKNDNNKDDFYYYLLFLRSSLRYKQDKLKESFNDLFEVAQNTNNKEHEACALWMMGIIAILTQEEEAISEKAFLFLQSAFNMLFPSDQEKFEFYKTHQTIDKFELCNDPILMKHIKEKMHQIISQGNKDAVSIGFCSIIGTVIMEQNNIDAENRKFAIDCLRYATINNNQQSFFSLLGASNQEVTICEKIYHLESILYHNKHLCNQLESTLIALYPKNIYEQIRLIIYFIDKNNKCLLEEYLSKMYRTHFPIRVDPAELEEPFSLKEMEQLIDQLLKIECIKKSADSFMQKMKDKQDITPQEHFCAIFCGSLLSYSHRKTQLELARDYLAMCTTIQHLTTNMIKINIGHIYYNLALYYKDAKNKDMNTAIRYLLLACQLHNTNAILVLSKFLLDEIPETMPFAPEIINYLEQLHTSHPTIITESLLKRHAQQKTPQPKPIITHHTPAVLQNLTKNYQQEYKNTMENLLEKQKEFPSHNLLISNPEEKVCEGESKIPLLELYPILIKQDKPDASRLFQCAILLLNNGDTPAIIPCIEKGILNGIVQLSETTNVFKNKLSLNLLCILIRKIIDINKKPLKLLLLKNIKRILRENKLTINIFEAFYKEYYKCDLAKYPVWKNAKK